jgi:hypothetical protein
MKYIIYFLAGFWVILLVYGSILAETEKKEVEVPEILIEDTVEASPLVYKKYYGGKYTESANDIIETSDGGFLIVGSSSSYTKGSYDILVLKIDRYGGLIWSKRYGNFNMDNAVRVIELQSGEFLIAGHTNSYGGDEIHDMLLLKIDAQGTPIWKKIMGGYNEDYATHLLEMPDGSLIITGYTYSYGVGQDDVFIMKMKSTGDTLWTQLYGGLSNEHSYSIDTTGDGFIITGFTKSFERKGLYDAYVVKTDLDGNIQWSQVYGGDHHDRGQVIKKVDDGYIIGGSSMSSGAGLMDLFLCKLDLEGNWLWAKTYGTELDETTSAMSLSSDNGFLLIGITNSPEDVGGTDLIAVKTDENGDTLWTGIWGGPELESGASIIQTSDNHYALVGKAVPEAGSSYDFLLLMLDENGFEGADRNNISIEVNNAIFHQDTAASLVTHGIEIRNEFSYSNINVQHKDAVSIVPHH